MGTKYLGGYIGYEEPQVKRLIEKVGSWKGLIKWWGWGART